MATRNAIINQTLAKLDEITVFDEAQQVPTVALVAKLLDEATIDMLRNAPLHLLEPTKVNTESATLNHYKDADNGWGYVGLPTDFLRLYSFKMEVWHRPVTKAISIESPKYALQKNKITRGGLAKPVVAINQWTEVNDGSVYDDPDIIDEGAPPEE